MDAVDRVTVMDDVVRLATGDFRYPLIPENLPPGPHLPLEIRWHILAASVDAHGFRGNEADSAAAMGIRDDNEITLTARHVGYLVLSNRGEVAETILTVSKAS